MKRLEQLKTIMRDTFGVVSPEVTTRPSGPETIAVVDPWPLGTDKRLADKRLADLGFKPCDLPDLGPYSSAYWL